MGITAQRTRTWKWSNDPLYEEKKQWVLGAYKAAEAGTLDGVLVSFDECGPISLKPHPGRGWFATKATGPPAGDLQEEQRQCASCWAPTTWAPTACGVVSRPARSTAKVVLEFLKDIRRRYPPDVQVYIVMDGLSAHWTQEIRDWAVANHVGLLPTPTNASHLNRIECHFWAYVEFVINGSDYPDWTSSPKPPRPTSADATATITTLSSEDSKTDAKSPDTSYRRNERCRPTSEGAIVASISPQATAMASSSRWPSALPSSRRPATRSHASMASAIRW